MALQTKGSDKILSLFSGAGGFSYGFAEAGLRPVCGAELNKDACATYEANVGGACRNIDLSTIDPAYFTSDLGLRNPLAVIGGPPCQGFSTAGLRAATDPRNELIFNYLRIVKEVGPRWFIFENVEGLLTSGEGLAVSSLVHEFLRLGYSVRVQKVNFAAYGVPQSRKRVLIVGNRMGMDFSLPPETHSYDSGKAKKTSLRPPAPSLEEAISGLGHASQSRRTLVPYSTESPVNSFDSLMRKGNESGGVWGHWHSTKVEDVERLSMLRAGQTMKDLPQEYWHDSYKRRAFRRVKDGTPTEKRGGAPAGIKRLRGHLQSLTITGGATREFIHPHFDRPLTLRECARLQTFPDRYSFQGNQLSVAQQIGNAVPPLAATVIAEHLLRLDGILGSGHAHVKFGPPRLLGFLLTEANGMSPALQKTERLLGDLMYEAEQLELCSV